MNSKPSLNPQQTTAVNELQGPLLVLAGAGSGKTRILTYRIANLIESGAAFPGEIVSLTFTNKSAQVMKERVAKLLQGRGIPVEDLWISTFHSMGAKILRQHGYRIGLDPGFTIYDDGDQLSLIKECMEKLQISDKIVSPKAVLHKIGSLKNDAISAADFQPKSVGFMEAKMAPIIKAYDLALRHNNAVDFGDLILKTYELFKNDAQFRNEFQERYRFVLVDEYQDTNAVQYQLLRLMTEKHRNLCVVGDEDQSIYGWRGADIRNILDFEKDFPDAKTVKLEENYRSSAHIIRAANRVIANNTQRKDKTLFTSNPDGDRVEVHFVENDFEESKFIARGIQAQVDRGVALNEVAIFYRTNAQSRMIEDRLRYDRISYKIFGGVKFYARAEVKDALAYLRLFANPRDEVSLGRIINVPARGIGKQTLDTVRGFAASERLPLFEALGVAAKGEGGGLGSGPQKKLKVFLELYARLQKKCAEMPPVEFYAYMLDETGYLKALENENNTEAQSRIENLKELGTVVAEYEARSPEPSIEGFLQEIALFSDIDAMDESAHYVSLMTVHSAKGLEYSTVFLAGMEEELFPHVRPGTFGEIDPDALEEERRLCYVGLTRARHHLYLTSARQRRVFGISHMRNPSRFIEELPQDEIIMQDHGPKPAARFRTVKQNEFGDTQWGGFEEAGGKSGHDGFGGAFESNRSDGYSVGAKVTHPDFGLGVVLAREGQNEGLKVTVRFNKVGVKKFVVRFAPLELVT